MEDERLSIGKKIEKKLAEKHITKAELARQLGVSRNWVYDNLKTDDISLKMLEKVCEVLNESMYYFVGKYIQESEEKQITVNRQEQKVNTSDSAPMVAKHENEFLKRENEMLREMVKSQEETIKRLIDKIGK